MPKMSPTILTKDFYSPHPMRKIQFLLNFVLIQSSIKTRPTATRIKFRIRRKKVHTTPSTLVVTLLFMFPIFSREGTFGSLLAQHTILFF